MSDETYYGKLFDFLESEFGITPIITEMNDLVEVVRSLPRYKEAEGNTVSDELPIVQELESLIDPFMYIMSDARRQVIIERAIEVITHLGDENACLRADNEKIRKYMLELEQITEMRDGKHLVAKFMLDHGFATGHGNSIPDLLGELSGQIFELRQEGIAVLQLAALMQSLEFPPSAATLKPEQLASIGRAICEQAKQGAK